MQYRYGVIGRCTLVLLFAAWAASSWADALTDRAKRLLDQQKSKEAYELLQPQEGARAGDPEFDFLLGLAAMESGEQERAVFAFERVLAVQPNNTLARAYIAQAYYNMGELETAKREFETVREEQKRQQVPDRAKEQVNDYLSAIQGKEDTQINGYLEFGAGYDTNVNAATSSNQVAVPVPGGTPINLTLTSQNSTQRADSFGIASGYLGFTRKLSSEWAIVGNAFGSGKLNRKIDEFDTLNLAGELGMRYTKDKEQLTLGAQVSDFELDWGRYRETAGALAQWRHTFNEAQAFTVYGQYTALRYPTQEIRDANRKILGVNYQQAFNGDAAPVIFATTYFGREDELAEGVPHLGHKPIGIRLGGQLRIAAGFSAFANATYEHRKYGGPEPVFDIVREDNQSDIGGGLSYVVRPGTTLIGQFAYTQNRSNIELYQFHRTVYTASVRFNF